MKALIVIPFALLLNDCSSFEDEYSDLSPENSLNFKLGDTLIFFSNTNKTDSFIVTSFERDYMVHDKKYHYQFEEVYFSLINDTDVNYFVINHTMNSFEISWFDLNARIYYSQKPIVMKYELQDNIIDDVYFVIDNRSRIKDIYFNNKYGIIRYDVSNAEYFELRLNND